MFCILGVYVSVDGGKCQQSATPSCGAWDASWNATTTASTTTAADWDEDLVDYDTSVKRLFTFAFFLAFILALIATNLSIILVQDESSITFHNSLISKVSQSIPHLVLLFNDGSMEIYEFSSSNTKLIHAWTFKVPHQKENLEENFNEQLEHHLGHTLLMSRSEIFIFYMSGKKDITILTNNAKANLTHQSIRQSKVPRNMFYNSKSLQIDNKLWLFGGMDQTVTTVPYNFYGYWYSNDFEVIQWKVSNKTLIWNLERQIYYLKWLNYLSQPFM